MFSTIHRARGLLSYCPASLGPELPVADEARLDSMPAFIEWSYVVALGYLRSTKKPHKERSLDHHRIKPIKI